MTETREFRFPDELFLLEEINLPADLAASLLGQTVPVDIAPEEQPAVRQVEPDAYPCLIAPDGTYWNCYSPMQVSFRDSKGKVWRIPRHWITGDISVENHISYNVTREHVLSDLMVFPNSFDLAEINMPPRVCTMRGGQPHDDFEVRISPNHPVSVHWSGYDCRWRIPHRWRRRRIRLPETEILTAQDIPPDVSAEFGGQIVTVNYHPGTICCLPHSIVSAMDMVVSGPPGSKIASSWDMVTRKNTSPETWEFPTRWESEFSLTTAGTETGHVTARSGATAKNILLDQEPLPQPKFYH